MPKAIVSSILWLTARAAAPDQWAPVGDAKLPNCAEHSCVVREGATLFEIGMVTETRKNLEYLRQLTIKNRATGRTQEFDTSAVNGTADREPFRLYRVNLRGVGTTDLALRAYGSAGAGESFYYFLYDPKTQRFVGSEDTIPKLSVDPKTRALTTDVQGVAFKIEDLKLIEK